tara:strand:- start:83 stop:268 length:186 start_codon:yes stop_codon:yes gene_type:complete
MEVNAKKKEEERIQELGNMCGHFVVWVFYCRFELVLLLLFKTVLLAQGLTNQKKAIPFLSD